MPMNDPPHPGEIIREDCLEPLGLSVTAAAKGLGGPHSAIGSAPTAHTHPLDPAWTADGGA